MVSTNFLAQKTIGKKNIFSIFYFISRNVFKREIFVNFLSQKFMTKYGIVSTYSVTFVSQKILTCLQCMHILFFKLFLCGGHLKKYKTSSAFLLLGCHGEPNGGCQFDLGVEDMDPMMCKPGVDGMAGALQD